MDHETTQASNDLLRHTVATVAYRGGKVLRDVPEGVAGVRVGEGGRTGVEILAHISDLFDWAVSLVEGHQVWKNSSPLAWPQEVARFHQTLKAFDDALVKNPVSQQLAERLFQGPISDALTHIGQIAQLRRLAGAIVRPENYFVASVEKGCVGPDQPAAKLEF